MNTVILLGNLGKDPLISQVGERKKARLNIATTEYYTDKSTGELKEKTTWHTVDCYGYTAEKAINRLQKGSRVGVRGSITNWKYTDSQGIERDASTIDCHELELLGNLKDKSVPMDNGQSADRPAPVAQMKAARKKAPISAPGDRGKAALIDEDDDLPF